MTLNDESFPFATFEEKATILQKMTEEDIKRTAEQLPHICKDYCGKCPTYVGTGEKRLAFCSLGKSEIIKEQKDCLCNQCPLTKQMSMRWDHYCTRGDAMDLSDAEKS